MLRYIIILSLTLLVISCGDGMIKKKEYTSDGVLYRVQSMDKDSVLQGETITYYDNGTDIFERAHYLNGELSGPREIFYEDGVVEIREQYLHDVLVDTLYNYYPSGSIRSKFYYRDGTITGDVLVYYESGGLKEVVAFEKDEENGRFIEYHENGNLMWEGTYVEGDNEVGELKGYNEDGILEKIMICDDRSICTTIWTIELGDIAPSNEATDQ